MKEKLVMLIAIVLCAAKVASSQQITFDQIPENLQLYPRDAQDSSEVVIAGRVTTSGFAALTVEVSKDSQTIRSYRSPLNYEDSTATFSLSTKIHAELAEYHFKIFLDTVLVAQRDSIVCGDVYLINGQSNALAIDYDGRATYQSEWLRSFGNSIQDASACSGELPWGLAQGHTNFTHAAIGVWGLRLGQLLVEKHQIPIAIINGATGGSTIARHLRNDANPIDCTTNYGRLLFRAQTANLQHAVKAIFWYQGEANTDQSYATYAGSFWVLHNSWKTDYSNLEKIYLFQLRPSQAENFQSQLRETQRQLVQLFSDVEIMSTTGLPGHDGLHYHYDGYSTMGEWIYRLVARDFYGSTDTMHIAPPNIQKAFYSSTAHDEITLVFNQPILWPEDSLGRSLKDYFYLVGDNNNVSIDSGLVQNQSMVVLQLSEASNATGATYLPGKTYNNSIEIYEGPWLKNLRGIGALSFHNFPIEEASTAIKEPVTAPPASFRLDPAYPNPFSISTTISYHLPNSGPVSLVIYDLKGEVVKSLINEVLPEGNYSVRWQMENWQGLQVASGIYYMQLKINGFSQTRKLTAIR